MDKTFKPQNFEKKHYNNWLNNNYFSAKIDKNKKPFTIIMPPPNITSILHIGHAYGISIMDSIVRFKRMQGYSALLLPGVDHAAIATEAIVVDNLKKQGISKHDLGREKFIEKMHEWYDEYGNAIIEQFKLIGISADWEKHAFTLDEKRSKSVKEAFVRLYNKGLIYQGDRITNWCPSCKTAISDIEVEYEEHDSFLWHIEYKLENGEGGLTVATTRPETLLGDTAVAVNPKDKRYKHLIGKNVVLPILNKLIPIIADDYVDSEFGTGVVKITPAHDPNDYEIGQRHNLEEINILNLDGTLNENAQVFVGVDRLEARPKIVELLKEQGALVKTENYKKQVGHCQRCNEVVEPIISKQWYVKMQDLAKRAIEVVEDGSINFLPKRFEKTYFNWMNNIRDWCISRQIWSGHKIPVFYEEGSDEPIVEMQDPREMEKYKDKKLVQDPDSLDTWFSSALWPFSTLGWPEKTEEMDYFFPTDLMVTGYDIIFFWVARMIFSSLEYTDQIPFKDVLMHGLIRDTQGRKMSKSLGNGIDPLEVVEKYGADSLRISLLQGVGIGQDARFGIEKTESARNFLNKLWNASRFVLDNISKTDYKILDIRKINLTLADKWILTELQTAISDIEKAYSKYDLGLVLSLAYEFIWNKYCDWYIEASKVKLYEGNEQEKIEVLNVLHYVLDAILKILHPIAPFTTEEIYLNTPNNSETIMLEKFPEYNKKLVFGAESINFNLLIELIKNIRNTRSELNIADNVKTDLYLIANKTESKIVLQENSNIISKLALGKKVLVVNSTDEIKGKFTETISSIAKAMLPNHEIFDAEQELARLTNDLEIAENELRRAEGMLSNQKFVSKAPQKLVEAEQEKVIKYKELIKNINQSILNLKSN